MKLSRKALDAYNYAVKRQGDNAENATRRALGVWFEENPGAPIEETREFCVALMQEVGGICGNAAGDAAYALRDIVAEAAGVELPNVDYAYRPDPVYVEKTARYQVGKLDEGDAVGFADAIADASRYFAERGANDTMAALGKADARKLGKKVRFARVPTGATTCPYCLMLASRGFVYGSELKALNANHRHCDCRIVEGFEGMTIEGYDPDLYYDMWRHPEKYHIDGNGVAAGVSEAVDPELRAWAKKYPKEEMWVKKANGEEFYKEGDALHVPITDKELVTFKDGKARHTHTTPIGGTFGDDDIALTVDAWLLEHEVVDSFNGVSHCLVRTAEATKDSAERFKNAFAVETAMRTIITSGRFMMRMVGMKGTGTAQLLPRKSRRKPWLQLFGMIG